MTLPFRSEQTDDPDANYDVSVWRCGRNLCEHQAYGTRCETATGLYYGSAEDEVTKFCPRHFYALHGEPNAAYRLVDPAGGSRMGADGDLELVAVLPWLATPTGEENEPDRNIVQLAVWRCPVNICECAGDGWCDGTGYVYGSSDSHEPKCCARHFFTDSGYTLLEIGDDHYQRLQLLDACERASWLLHGTPPAEAKAHKALQLLAAACATAHADPYCYGIRPEVAVRAAGPDLLEACRLALHDLEDLDAPDGLCKSLPLLRQAIARATGKAA